MLPQFCEWPYALSLYGQNMPRCIYIYANAGSGRGIRTSNRYSDDPAQDMSAKRKSRNLFILLRHRRRRRHHHHGRCWLLLPLPRCLLESELWYNCKSFRFKVDGESEKDIWVNFYRRYFLLLLLLLPLASAFAFSSPLSRCHRCPRTPIIMHRIPKISSLFQRFRFDRQTSFEKKLAHLASVVYPASLVFVGFCSGNGIIWSGRKTLPLNRFRN